MGKCKDMMDRMRFKPRELKQLVEKESWKSKVRIIGFAFLTGAIAGSISQYYDYLGYRIQQYQDRAMAGKETWAEYRDPISSDTWAMKNELSVLEGKDFKDLKYITAGWDSKKVDGYATGPQGDDEGWFKQTEKATAWIDAQEEAAKCQDSASKEISCDSERFSEWETMHTNVNWFDTAGCINQFVYTPAEGNVIGFANAAFFTAAWSGAKSLDGYRTDISFGGEITVNDEDLYRSALKGYLTVVEDCDVDCQAKGSQMSVVAAINGAALGIISLNALFMFIGTWRYRWRVCSIYCTFFACLFQFAVLVTSGVFLFSPYTMELCGRSIQHTAGDSMMWHMADDVQMNITLWVSQLILMFVFVCFGMCQTRDCEK